MEGKACEGGACHMMDAIAGDHQEVLDRKKKSLSLHITQDQLSHADDDDATIYQRCAERLKGSHKMESLIEAMCHNEPNELPSVRMSNDQEQEEKTLTLSENHNVCEGLELLDRVEDLHTKYAVAEHNTKILELNLLDLTEKIRLLEDRIQEQEHNIHEAQTYQSLADYETAQCPELEATEEEEDEPSPIRVIYLRQFHDHVRDAICRKLAETTLWGRHYKALQRQVAAAAGSKGVRGHTRLGKLADRKAGLWEFAQEAHSIAPCTFKKDSFWNQFVDELQQDVDFMKVLGLSPESLGVTKFACDPKQDEDASCFNREEIVRNRHVFAELVTQLAADDPHKPFYTELYMFVYNVHPETMDFKATFGDEPRHDHEEPVETGGSSSSIDQFLSSCFPLPSLPADRKRGGAEGSYYSPPREPTSSTVSTIGDSSEEAEAKATAT